MCERGEITFRQGGPGGRRPGVATAYSLEYLEVRFSEARGQGPLRSSVFSEVSRVLDEGLELAPATAYSRRPRTRADVSSSRPGNSDSVSPSWMPRRGTRRTSITPPAGGLPD